ncbi:hypothetical protein RS405_003772 [Serratia marcescens]|nr:hypothetical protein [Serratia marcescens]ELJ5815880.1 hypothetical protein [Serratia marcescens]ELN8908720.1 hypothetical protein [Serratia marcescens]ELT0474580.1 hypothetical protein [Serratia marcescens]EMB2193847.1 hypothetical protein [Serratia marcescens]
MTKAKTEFNPSPSEIAMEAATRYHAKLDALRSILIDRGGHESKESLEAIAENISAAFDKIKLL